MVYLAVWLDDFLLVGDEKVIEKAIQDLKGEGFLLNEDKTKEWIHQPHLYTKMEDCCSDLIKKLQRYKTPSAPKGRIIGNNGEPAVNTERNKLYRSGVGMLMYLVKHIRPDIANGVRGLSKDLVGQSKAAYKDMLRMIKFIIETQKRLLGWY